MEMVTMEVTQAEKELLELLKGASSLNIISLVNGIEAKAEELQEKADMEIMKGRQKLMESLTMKSNFVYNVAMAIDKLCPVGGESKWKK
jgi:hypothetical protein